MENGNPTPMLSRGYPAFMESSNILNNIKMENVNPTPLQSLEDWEDDVLERYPEPGKKAKDDYRNYVDSDRVNTVKEFYRLNHTYQTYDFVVEKEREFLAFNKREMYIWDAVACLNT